MLAALPAPDLERLGPHLKLVRLPLGEVLYESGTRQRGVYFPTTAIVSLLYMMADGASAEIAVVGNEGIVGVSLFMGGETTTSRAVTQSAGYAYRLSGKLLKEEFTRAGVLQQLLLRTRAELYLQQVTAGDPESDSNFMRYSVLGMEQRQRGMIRLIRRTFSGTSHLWMWDLFSMRAELERCGFEAIRECQFGDAEDPAFAELEDRSRFLDTTLQRKECALEARKPATRA